MAEGYIIENQDEWAFVWCRDCYLIKTRTRVIQDDKNKKLYVIRDCENAGICRNVLQLHEDYVRMCEENER